MAAFPGTEGLLGFLPSPRATPIIFRHLAIVLFVFIVGFVILFKGGTARGLRQLECANFEIAPR